MNLVGGMASNNLTDCQTVGGSFRTTVLGPVTNILNTTGINVTCASLVGASCPGSIMNGSCVFQHKLAVSCYLTGYTVKIRIQSNGLPLYCPAIPSIITFSELNIDFEVNFNPDVDVNSPLQSVTTASALSSLLCNISQSATPPSSSSYVNYGTSYNTLAGVSVDGVAILNANSANNADPLYPPSGFTSEAVDQCLARCQITGVYHYRMGSGCAKITPSGSLSSCASVPACSSNISQYSITSFSNYATLTIIGIARDGHIIFGPYVASGTEVTSGTDICNGMFYDSIGNYAYFATRKYPYLTGCYGPGNYPNVSVNCSINAPLSYSMSSYASAMIVTPIVSTTSTEITSITTEIPTSTISAHGSTTSTPSRQ